MTSFEEFREDSTPAPSEAADASWGPAGASVLALLAVGCIAASGLAVPLVLAADLGSTAETLLIGTALSSGYVLALAVVALGARYRGIGFPEAVSLRPVPVVPTLALGAAVAVAGRAAAGLWVVGLQALDIDIPAEGLDPTRLLPDTPLGIALIAVATVVLAPLAEEVVFRGVLLRAFEGRFGAAVGLAVSSIAFGSAHIVAYAIPPILFFGVLLGVLSLKTRSLWASIVAHSLFNAVALVALYALRSVGL